MGEHTYMWTKVIASDQVGDSRCERAKVSAIVKELRKFGAQMQ